MELNLISDLPLPIATYPRTGLSSSLMLLRACCTKESLTSQERGREPYFSIQVHLECMGGPRDLEGLFDIF